MLNKIEEHKLQGYLHNYHTQVGKEKMANVFNKLFIIRNILTDIITSNKAHDIDKKLFEKINKLIQNI
jgi:hypothetical protein